MNVLPWRRGPSQFARAADGSMTLIEHLIELRSRLFKATVAVTAGMVVGYLLADPVFDLLQRPYCRVNNFPLSDCDFTWLSPTDPFLQKLKIALWLGLIVSAPFWMYQVWAFVAPGLHRRERRWAYGFGALAIPLFVAGTLLAYFVVDRGLQFLLQTGLTEGATHPRYRGNRMDLLAWLKLLGDLPPAMRRAEPNTLRHRLLHTPARITRGQRHRRLHLPAHWPWSAVLAHAINTIARLPLPART